MRSFDCNVVCERHGPSGTTTRGCRVLEPDAGADTVVECDFASPPCDPAGP